MRRFYLLAAAGLLAALGCEDSKDKAPAPAVAPSDAPPLVITASALAQVCEGKPVEGAAKYEKKAGKPSPMEIFFHDGEEGFESKVSSVFAPWGAASSEEAQLVACVRVVEKKKARECSFNRLTKSQKKGARWVDQYDAELSISIREVATAKELATSKVKLEAPPKCPEVFNFTKDREADYPRFEPTLLGMAMPLQPKDVAPPAITREDVALACDGKPVPGTKPYQKGSEKSPARVFWREGEGAWVPSLMFASEKWKVGSATDTQLVVCVDATPGETKGECAFKGDRKLELIDTAYAITVVEAATGKKLDEKKIDAKAGGCPVFWDFANGTRRYAYVGDDTKSWIGGFVGVGASKAPGSE